MGRVDEEADGEVPDVDVKHGPGRPLTEVETQNIMTNDAQRTVRQAYLKKKEFVKHGFTDRCPGCSAIVRGGYMQPHSSACRRLLEGEARVQNAKTRLRERAKRMQTERSDGDEPNKRLKMEELEERTMREDPSKLA